MNYSKMKKLTRQYHEINRVIDITDLYNRNQQCLDDWRSSIMNFNDTLLYLEKRNTFVIFYMGDYYEAPYNKKEIMIKMELQSMLLEWN